MHTHTHNFWILECRESELEESFNEAGVSAYLGGMIVFVPLAPVRPLNQDMPHAFAFGVTSQGEMRQVRQGARRAMHGLLHAPKK